MKTSVKAAKIKAILEEGNQLQKIGEIERAIEQYQSILELKPDFFPALNQLADIYESRKEFERALDFYLNALKAKPHKLKILRQLAVTSTKVLSKKNKIEDAIATSREVIENLQFSSVRPETEQITGKVYEEFGKTILKLSIRQGEFGQGVAFWKEEVQKQPRSYWFHYNLGLVLSRNNRLDDAKNSYQKSLELNPDFYQALVELGKIFQAEKSYDRAIECGMRAIAVNPNPRPPYDLLNSPSPAQEKKLEQFFHQTVNNIDPSQLHAGGLYIAQQLKQNGNLEKAIAWSQTCIYHQLEKTKPEFISQYWNVSQVRDPDFAIVGVGKCGTTALYDYLVQHPQVLPAITKEPCYFSRLKTSLKTMKKTGDFSGLDEERKFYLAHFSPRPDTAKFVTGEASVDTIHSGTEQLVHSWFPTIKLIVILRNPIKRLISHYEQGLKGKKEQRSFEKVVFSELEILEEMGNLEERIVTEKKNLRYLHKGLYIYFLKPWIELFGKERVLVLQNEELARKPADVMKQLFNFLDLPDCTALQYTPKNVGYYPSQIDPGLIDRVSNFYKPHTQKLEEYLNRSFNW